jgi:acyl dehydratase
MVGIRRPPFPSSLFLEDFAVGDSFATGERVIDGADVAAFAALTGDAHPVHVDDAAAIRAGFPGRIAHGLFSHGVLAGLMTATGYDIDSGVATLAWTEVSFPAPVLPGDTVRGEFEIVATRPSRSRPGTGIVEQDCRLLNQRNEVVVTARHALLVKCRGNESAARTEARAEPQVKDRTWFTRRWCRRVGSPTMS